ncbi:MAG: hypothetical protein MZV64_63415 [Ignavibacteriales bacterium]|nr:hypothetical protein [Ignavibacteriales bacterium]
MRPGALDAVPAAYKSSRRRPRPGCPSSRRSKALARPQRTGDAPVPGGTGDHLRGLPRRWFPPFYAADPL